MIENCHRCGKALPRTYHTTFVLVSSLVQPDDTGWHWTNPAPDAAGAAAVVAVCNKCDPPPVLIPCLQHEALMAIRMALHDDRALCELDWDRILTEASAAIASIPSMVKEIERLREGYQFARDWMNEVRRACRHATGGNATFIDDDVTKTIRHLMNENCNLSASAKVEWARADRAEALVKELRETLADLVDLETNGLFVAPDAHAVACIDKARAVLARAKAEEE